MKSRSFGSRHRIPFDACRKVCYSVFQFDPARNGFLRGGGIAGWRVFPGNGASAAAPREERCSDAEANWTLVLVSVSWGWWLWPFRGAEAVPKARSSPWKSPPTPGRRRSPSWMPTKMVFSITTNWPRPRACGRAWRRSRSWSTFARLQPSESQLKSAKITAEEIDARIQEWKALGTGRVTVPATSSA